MPMSMYESTWISKSLLYLTACVKVILLAFLLRFNGAGGQPVMNFANQGDKCTTFAGTETFSCPEIEYVPLS